MADGTGSQPGGAPTFRDPDGSLLFIDGQPVRIVNSEAGRRLERFLESELASRWVDRGALPRTRKAGSAEYERFTSEDAFRTQTRSSDAPYVFLHDAVAFPSFPDEWCASMLSDAGKLTLDLAGDLLSDGRGLKDATPYNVLFRGSTPVFVDLLSIEERRPEDPIWLPYGQFVRTFVIPLFLLRACGQPPRTLFATARDGITPEEAFRRPLGLARLRPPGLTAVTLPVLLARWLGRRAQAWVPAANVPPKSAQSLLARRYDGLRRALNRLQPPDPGTSHWTDYSAQEHGPAYHAAKAALVTNLVRSVAPARVLDVGCNTGEISLAAAQAGGSVVAIDSDERVIEHLWSAARRARADVLPLVVDLADPTPARGWRNREWPAFVDRAAGNFDLVLAMAVVHHFLVRDLIPLNEIVDLIAGTTRRWAMIEYVPPNDSHFRILARGRGARFEAFDITTFELSIRRHFHIVSRDALPVSGRVAYTLRKIQ
jgi:SAM-dependent methyltransferase